MTDVEEDRFLQAMSLAVVIFGFSAIGVSIVHIAFRHGFRLSMIPFVFVIEYSLLMIVVSIGAAALYVWDAPWMSLSNLGASESHLDWEDDEEEGGGE